MPKNNFKPKPCLTANCPSNGHNGWSGLCKDCYDKYCNDKKHKKPVPECQVCGVLCGYGHGACTKHRCIQNKCEGTRVSESYYCESCKTECEKADRLQYERTKQHERKLKRSGDWYKSLERMTIEALCSKEPCKGRNCRKKLTIGYKYCSECWYRYKKKNKKNRKGKKP